MREFKHDAIGAHLIGIHYNEALKTWSEGESSPETVLGALKKGQAAHVFRGIGGPDFNLMYSENTKNVFQPGADVIGGFCFLSRGLVTVQKRVVDRNGKEFKVQIDLAGILPKPLFEGGAELQQQSQRLLNGARLSKNGWQIKTPGKIKGVPFGSLLKALRYFEIAQTSGGRLILMIPTNEYASSVAANAVLLKTSPAEARRAVYAVGKIYARTLQKLGRAFFPSVKLEVVLTHDLSFQKKLKRFEKQNQKQFNEAKIGQADGFISGYTPEQKRIIRRLWEEETANYLRLFSYIFSRETPTIFGLHARDFVGYPLEGLALAEKIVGKQNINKNENVVFSGGIWQFFSGFIKNINKAP